MVAIIDYDAGNIKSVEKALLFLGEEVKITRNHSEILSADRVILPGVGAFSDAMSKLHYYNLVPVIKEVIKRGTPFLGICLGLQLLFERSDEGEGIPGLGILEGEILKIPSSEELKVPHMGWNSLLFPKESLLFNGIPQNAYVYFVHSYYLKATQKSIIAATCEYGIEIHAAVEKDNVWACQFHPEKSSEVGLAILKNFLSMKPQYREEG